MSQAPWGPSPAQSPEPAAVGQAGEPPAPASGRSKRTVVIAAGAAAALLALAGGAFVMMRGGGTTPEAAPVTHSASPSPSASPSVTTQPTTAPTIAVNGRNPFAATATGKGSASGRSTTDGAASTKVTTKTVTSSSVVVRSKTSTATTTSTRTTTATTTVTGPTATVTATPVYLTLLSIDVANTAGFIVNGTSSSGVAVGDSFGSGSLFTYVGTVVPGSGTYSGQKCASVTYVDSNALQICQGQQLQVS